MTKYQTSNGQLKRFISPTVIMNIFHISIGICCWNTWNIIFLFLALYLHFWKFPSFATLEEDLSQVLFMVTYCCGDRLKKVKEHIFIAEEILNKRP